MPVLNLGDAIILAADLRHNGKRVVFTNGVFDLLHPGHVRYLQAARAEGDALVVGVNSDRAARGNKGPSRPITPEAERAEILGALECVTAAVIFDEPTPAAIIRLVRPHVLVKGADWPAAQIVGRATVAGDGGRVVRVAVEAGWSTTAIIARATGIDRTNPRT
jgi:D-beta-D-heptose 7-phosphate kinase/D-beta-D-heptose 1-phosphate adenosyltransferase